MNIFQRLFGAEIPHYMKPKWEPSKIRYFSVCCEYMGYKFHLSDDLYPKLFLDYGDNRHEVYRPDVEGLPAAIKVANRIIPELVDQMKLPDPTL